MRRPGTGTARAAVRARRAASTASPSPPRDRGIADARTRPSRPTAGCLGAEPSASCPATGVEGRDGHRLAGSLEVEHAFVYPPADMERRYELEILRRSLAMLTPGTRALTREQAIDLLEELQDVQARLDSLKVTLRRLADE